MIDRNNETEHSKRIKHEYQNGYKILLKRGMNYKIESLFTGPYEILGINENGTVRLKVRSVIDDYNIRNIKPFRE